ncbi:ImmA/IrrE family metallo-endopeptidase [Sorangium sp. So ce1182]|uniref:ImmA/IrrE family metallo-endopeptidase n=1 Tax=Sorangium sp. So ce1182 TaxID=3133334 RepID=UPI003F5F7E97
MSAPQTSLWRVIRDEKADDDRPHHVANMVLRRLEIEQPPVPVELIVLQLGIRLKEQPSAEWIGQVDPTVDPPVISINSDDALVRQRFTMAHEIGHLLLHPLNRMFRDTTLARRGDVREEEANEFAASLLMPLWMLDRFAKSKRYDATAIAGFFKVSYGALAMQLKKLT